MRMSKLLAHAVAAFAAAVPAHATVFTGTFGLTDIQPGSGMHFVAPVTPFSVTLSPGQTVSMPFVSFTINNLGAPNGIYLDALAGQFSFTGPSNKTPSSVGGQLRDDLFSPPTVNFLSDLEIDSSTITFPTGETLAISFDVFDTGTNSNGVSGTANGGTITANFTDMTASPPTVDEPPTILLLGVGLIGFALCSGGGMTRSRRLKEGKLLVVG